jgi:iron complex transport system substrate-binding protein
MRSRTVVGLAIALVFVACHWARARLAASSPPVAVGQTLGPPQRIIGLAPSVTEVLFALGLGDRVAGVTRFCDYPPEARRRPQVGGFLDPSLEAIVALRPDLLVLLSGAEQNLADFARLGLPTLAVRHSDVDGVLESITTIGRVCGVPQRAEELVGRLQARLQRVRLKTAGRTRPRVLVSVDRTLGGGSVQDVYIAGCDGHIDRLIALAGGQNAYRGPARFPIVSAEGILHLNPDTIIDLVPDRPYRALDRQAIRREWQALPRVAAVAAGRVYVLDEPYLTIPGPRFVQAVEELARLIHPEVQWEEGAVR